MNTLTFGGQIADGMDPPYAGPLEVFLTSADVLIGRSGWRGYKLRILPFVGTMFLLTPYELGPDEDTTTYQLSLSGKRIGTYARGGGPDGDYDTFRLESAEIQGAFDQAGLTVSIVARTFPAFAVCCSTRERQDNVHAPIEVRVRFLVPPAALETFLQRHMPVTMIRQFGWPQQLFMASKPE